MVTTMTWHDLKNLRTSLKAFGESHVELAYHKPSNTHIAYCMPIGVCGVKGFGHTADFAFDRFLQNLVETLTKAKDHELKYWAERCETETKAVKHSAEIAAITREPLSGEIGMAVPARAGNWATEIAEAQELSRNQFVTDLLDGQVRWLERRMENEFTDVIRHEIKTAAGKGEQEWPQRVPPELQANLILLARRFGVSVAMLARYLLVKEYD